MSGADVPPRHRKAATVPDYRNSSACHSDSDGECHWRRCPQNRDGEPHKSGRHCPLDLISPETHTEAEAKAAVAAILNRAARGPS